MMLALEQLAWLEATALSTWARESGGVFFTALTLHSLALGMVVGIQVAFNLRVLGVARQVPLLLMTRFMPLMWWGVAVVTFSGSVLLLAYPAKALTNPLFFIKLGCIVAALLMYRGHILKRIKGEQVPNTNGGKRLRIVAAFCLFLWASSVFAGRFLAYTNSVLLASHYF